MTPQSTNEVNTNTTNDKKPLPHSLKPWAIYGICLLISAIFFFLFGFNSPIYAFNTDIDYNWFMTMGRGFVNGKIPYRDLFEHKGPIIYFITGFCCLFQNPNFIMLLLEIISMSLFLYFTYRIASKRLNTFCSLITVSIISLAIFISNCRMINASAVEEFCLPIYAYFLLCWLEFMLEKSQWNWVRALCLGICFGVLFWVKYTLVYFIIVPMLAWFILSLCRRQYRTMLINLLLMLAGVLIITAPIIIFYAAYHALDDLFRVYFIINLTTYGNTNPEILSKSYNTFFEINHLILFLIIWGVISFTFRHYKHYSGWILLAAFLVNFVLLVFSAKSIIYYYGGLFPYAIIGVVNILAFINSKLDFSRYHKLLFVIVTVACVIVCIPFSSNAREWGRNEDTYVSIQIANVIHTYEKNHNTTTTLFCYKINDCGFYNATKKAPNNYYFAQNNFDYDRLPELHDSHERYVAEQTSDFIITLLVFWETEKDFISKYYQPCDNNGDYTDNVEANTYHYRRLDSPIYIDADFVLLRKI